MNTAPASPTRRTATIPTTHDRTGNTCTCGLFDPDPAADVDPQWQAHLDAASGAEHLFGAGPVIEVFYPAERAVLDGLGFDRVEVVHGGYSPIPTFNLQREDRVTGQWVTIEQPDPADREWVEAAFHLYSGGY